MMKLKILIVEDEIVLKDIYASILGDITEKLEFCDHPQKGWKAIDREKYDLIITDLKMPIIDGDEFVKIIRGSKFNSTTPVVICSGHMDRKILSELNRESKLYFLNKPFTGNTLLQLIEKIQEKTIFPKKIVEENSFDLLLKRLNEQINISKIEILNNFADWNFESILITSSIYFNNELQLISILMHKKTFLNLAGKVHGTIYKDLDEEVFGTWKSLLIKYFNTENQIHFFQLRSFNFLDYDIKNIRKISFSNEEMFIYLS